MREFPEHPLGDRVVHNIDVILNDPEVVLVAEMMGGSHPAYDFTVEALKKGKHVVTSNKELVATKGCELLALAKEKKCYFIDVYNMCSDGNGNLISEISPDGIHLNIEYYKKWY